MDTISTISGNTTTSLAMASAVATSLSRAAASNTALSSVMTRANDIVVAHGKSSWIGMFARLILSILQLISTILYYALKLTTISIPTLLFTLLSTSLTVTMNATTLVVVMAMLVSAVSWVVRYRYLNMYSRLPPEPQRKEPEIDLFPDTREGEKAGLSNYLDEFLSAIKIFGYMERNVHHELTRSMQTRKLIAGETLNLEEEKGFCIVVDGVVEIFVKSVREARREANTPARESSWEFASDGEEEEHAPGQQPYQLLTEVRNGASMSSLFTIMSLFTEDVKLQQPADNSPGSNTMQFDGQASSTSRPMSRRGGDVPFSVPSTPAAQRGVPVPSASAFSNVPPLSLDDDLMDSSRNGRPRPIRKETSSVHPDIIARATVDTTIAIIPASAFRRLIRLYPKATAHIVHVILSRFQRVTLATAFGYLGLHHEVLQIEKTMARFTTAQLPNVLRGEPLQRIKDKFKQELDRHQEGDLVKGIALHNVKTGRRRRSSTGLRKEAVLQAISKRRPAAGTATIPTLSTRPSVQGPSSAQQARFRHQASSSELSFQSPLSEKTFNPFTADVVSLHNKDGLDDDSVFRQSVLECVFRSIGLSNTNTISRGQESLQGSPRLVSYNQRRHQAVFSNSAFSMVESLDGSIDGDTDSVASGFNFNGSPDAQTLAQDMQDDLEIVFFPEGSVLVEQGERNPGLFYVIDGFLDIGLSTEASAGSLLNKVEARPSGATRANGLHYASRVGQASAQPSTPSTPTSGAKAGKDKRLERKSVSVVKPGSLAGYMGSVTSYRSFHDVVARTDVYVGFLPSSTIERLVDRYPIILLTMAKRLTNLLPRMIRNIDFALDWVHINAGQLIFQEGDDSDAIYLVLNGRLRLIEDRKGGGMNVKAEFGQGDSVGELEVLTESNRSGTLHAIRDTEVVRFPRSLFNSLAQEQPSITIKISKIIASRMRNVIDDAVLTKEGLPTPINRTSFTSNLRTVAIVPVTEGVPVVDFGTRLVSALNQIGLANGAVLLDQAAILNHLGKHAFNKIGKLRLSQYLADLEEKYSLVISMADTKVNSPWTQTCITQADCILLVGVAEDSPEIGEYERFMLGQKSTARKILILLHAERFSKNGLTRAWLKNRVWVNGGHFHVQMPYSTDVAMHPPSAARRTGPSLKQRVQILQAEIQKYTSRKVQHGPYYSPQAPFKGDFHRLARRLCGKSVGLVLGGGGARGFAEIGVIRALGDNGIPVDVIGGTSMGAFIGGLYARHADVVPIVGLAKKFAGRMSSLWRFALDLTYPSTSYTTGHEFNRGIFKTFGNTQIEDFWLEYYCNTTNISKSRAETHTSGYAWRYIRASMSLAGLLPPLCDDGNLLLDGGYVDNLTVAHMKSLGVATIFAVDVGSLDDTTPNTYGDTLSGVWAVMNRWNPFSTTPNPPTLAEIQARLAYVSSFDALERAKQGCIYMRPPIDPYGTLDWGKFDEISAVGYEYAKQFLDKLREEGGLRLLVEEAGVKGGLKRTMAPRRASV